MIYFASDFHLGAPNWEKSLHREKELCRWLDTISADATEIYLLGDLFDFWFEYKKVVPKGYVRLLGNLAKLTDKGIKITLFKGNHDMWMFGYLHRECGVNIVSDELIIERNQKKIFLHHGDGLGKGDKSYKFLRYIFRSKLCQWLFARIHPNSGIALAEFLSRRSRLSQKNRYNEYLGDEKEQLTGFCHDELKKRHFDYFIFGHRHIALDIKLSDNSKYINTGQWLDKKPYARFNGNIVELMEFNPSHNEKFAKNP